VNLPNCDSIQNLFRKFVPASFLAQLTQRYNLCEQGIYVPAVVLWLMMWQQLGGNRTLEEAVQQVVLGEPRDLLPDHKRIREGTVSSRTGSYSVARSKMQQAAVEDVFDHVFEQALLQSPQDQLTRRTYLLDGSSIRLAHTPELNRLFPPASNRHGRSHWPIWRVVVVHNLANGTAGRPAWGPMYGKHAVSEQALAATIMARMPPSIFIADRNFGVFSVIWEAHRQHHDVITRLTKARAQRLFGGTLPRQEGAYEVTWTPSRADRRSHPKIPADAAVHGRLIIKRVRRHRRNIVLYLFTTLDLPIEQITELYGRRWYIETDLRSIKQTLNLEQLRCKTRDMVAKELLTGIMAYNLIRLVQDAAAQSVGVDCRELSFRHVQVVVNAWLPYLLAATTAAEFQTLWQRMLRTVAEGKLPNREQQRRYRREVWGRPQVYPRRKPRKIRRRRTHGKNK
jgi:Transposase DDE domain